VAITDSILQAQREKPPEQQQQQSSWVQELLDRRAGEQRKKRNPVGFNFEREPFDPSSYYKSLNTFGNISRAATEVTKQVAYNREEARMQREFEANQAAANGALNGVNPNFTYSNGGGGSSYNGSSHKYGLKGVSNNTAKAADYWGGKYGIKTIGGRGPGSVPGSDHPKGRALDFMINNVSGGHKRGDALANDMIANYKKWNVKYVIWNRYIWQPGRGWRKYSGPSPHTDHVHVSFNK
jgi:hypothetical protein